MKARSTAFISLGGAFLLVLLLLAGCGGGQVKDPDQLLAGAADSAREAGSLHAQINVTLTPLEGESGMGLNVQGDAWMDMNAKVLEARFTVMGMELSLRYVDETAYLQIGGTWYEVTSEIISGIGTEAIGAAVDVLTAFPELFTSVSEVNQIGEKEVGDYQCVVLQVVPDIAAIVELEAVSRLADEMDMTSEEMVEYLEDADLEMEVSVQKDDPTMREVYLAASLDLSDVGSVAGLSILPSKARVEIWMEIPEYGMPVEVQPPPDAKSFEGL